MRMFTRFAALSVLLLALPGCLIIPMTSIGNQPVRPGMNEVLLQDSASVFTDEKVLLVEIKGTITGRPDSGLLRERNLVAEVAAALALAAEDEDVVAVLLAIDSPGGGVTASDLIHHEIQRYRARTGRPVLACMLGTAASGGYYVSMAAEEVWAQPTTITGSIGVISQSFGMGEALGYIGIEPRTITTGPLKDLGSPYRPMTDAERALIQAALDEMHGRFVDVVAAGRPRLTRERVAELADGRIYTAGQALDLGLIDRLGDFDAAFRHCLHRAGVTDAELVTYRMGFGTPRSKYGVAAAGGLDAPTAEVAPGVTLDLDGLLARLLPELEAEEPFLYLWRAGL